MVYFVQTLLDYTTAGTILQRRLRFEALRSLGVNHADIEGLDQGMLHSQRAEFQVFYHTLKNYLGQILVSTELEDATVAIQPEMISRAEIVTKWPLLAYLITAAFCMGLSTTCHLCWVKNEKVSKMVTYLDYWGIALILLGSAYPYISFKYACGPFIVWRYIFTSIISVLTLIAMWASV
mmetsp:Transcript_20112/g.24794  ORF Transcript_20112/g.24794 Transcript_20112/m.24794 type:complete len:179 (-) Transcript_20112:434-970(-)|eukprot:CAMPEP_0170471008 /NCGR_PEP_ID=MMETSP0123-20130129/13317_1 /TAXON_ID=182087 /ORGANISM="Favella ehrenbergii, Strain Fehren 1" /LENGTH=178 /DNA_ID=CAMNT_0010738405 /DNA_START=392 /DNA_END=928 /DNA_ORIENTATION=-